MQIITAKSAGFCFGVNRAIEAAYGQIGRGLTFTYGPLIHNKEVSDSLLKSGIRAIDSLEQAQDGTVILRSHGVAKSVYDQMKEKNIPFIDGTCPFVKKIHRLVSQFSENGKSIIILGDSSHPEVIGIEGWCQNSATIFKTVEEIENFTFSKTEEYAVVIQTTFCQALLSDFISALKKKEISFSLHNTICSATSQRQNEAIELSKNVNHMLVIGDKTSSNTQKLYEICKKNCKNTYYIETIRDLVLNIFNKNDKIGVTAGASTPPAIIKEVISAMSETQNSTVQNIEEGEELTFQQLLDQSFVSLHTGDVVKGSIIQISNEEVSVNLGFKSDGVIPRGEYSSDPNIIPSKVLQIGDEIEVFVVRVNDGEGNVLLSKKRIEAQKGMEEIETAFNEKEPVTGKVTEVVKGGLIAVVNGVRVFIPSSQVSNRFIEDLNVFKGQDLTFNIIELDRVKRRIIGGRKELIAKEVSAKKIELFAKLEIGSKIIGTVSRLTDFGAFVDLGGVDGLIHISEMSWGRITNPKEILSEGQSVEAIVLDVDKEKGKISLSLKDINSNPWKLAVEKYAVGSVVAGKVVRMVPFGAFVELEPGVDGLVHISQIANKHVVKPEDELSVGQIIDVKVLEVNVEQKKISLSKREAEAPVEEEEVVTEQPAE